VSTETVIHHEIALALTALLFIALTWGQPNQVGTLTFLLLFGMRLSTKLNIFLGVPNPPSGLLPKGLAYLGSYFRRARFNALFPVSLAASIIVTILLAEAALLSSGGPRTGYVLMLSLAALGLLEHSFLMLPATRRRPAPESALWAWALGRDAKPTQVALAEADQ
jgi:putative photosynthetic complex assembly protein 2